MMKDNLEKFILENRAAFDDEKPRADLWQAIESNLEPKEEQKRRIIPIWRYARAAAAAVILIGTGILIGHKMSAPTDNALVMDEIFPEYTEMEQYYQAEVSEKFAQLTKYNVSPAIVQDLEQLDQIQQELKEDLANAPKGSEEQVINAMIKNYQTKLAILERVLDRIQSTNQDELKSEEDETINI